MFVLREVFDVPYDEIAEAVDKSPAAVRQIAHRAREHVAARRPRMEVEPREQQQVVERFLAAVDDRRRAGPDRRARPRRRAASPTAAALAQAARHPVDGAERVANFLSRFPRGRAGAQIATVWLNGAPAVRIDARRSGTTVGQRRRRGRPDHPHLRDAQPAQARAAGPGGRAHPLTRLTAYAIGVGPARCRERSLRSRMGQARRMVEPADWLLTRVERGQPADPDRRAAR